MSSARSPATTSASCASRNSKRERFRLRVPLARIVPPQQVAEVLEAEFLRLRGHEGRRLRRLAPRIEVLLCLALVGGLRALANLLAVAIVRAPPHATALVDAPLPAGTLLPAHG